ncbi:MAG: single-stranded-DNA-specific exonuclease RecJ, partial [Bacteroidales bacterium]|nr:single-stranded-DNA-specific exonuclease RecJ [Bacteroidales bacterium]
SIASDIVPLTGENRVLAFFGLKKLNSNPLNGLKAIIKTSGLEDKEIVIEDIVFKIGPRINAAGRMESGRTAVQLLIADSTDIAAGMSKEIDIYNNSRKNIDRKITLEALDIIACDPELISRNTNVLYNPAWHKGVVGIVASRITDYYYKPTVILTESNGYATGSARSVEGFDLYTAIEACSDLLENFGGHMYAAGLTLKPEMIKLFSDRFERIVSEAITEEQLTPQISIDAEIELSDINPKFYRVLKQFQPFGPENMAPMFLSKNVSDSGYGRIVGSTRDHLKLDLMQEEHPMNSYPAIAFQKAHHFENIAMGNPFDICYNIEENCFMGKSTIQIHIKDIKVKNVVSSLLKNNGY